MILLERIITSCPGPYAACGPWVGHTSYIGNKLISELLCTQLFVAVFKLNSEIKK